MPDPARLRGEPLKPAPGTVGELAVEIRPGVFFPDWSAITTAAPAGR